ncbi:hypothetical protein [Phyllobacterium chamaecytisi]|uniref:hypothetical protein n=1 Tax=Phyllobacterium chamaecytisi TaxID=2876082 RepID=UPI001CCB735E|nr:hypothetical protein [Phyllobacterium sp. KW56]MBZ9603949.1 hypothetical protein [Phyllobacterium sp. KW56]
MRLITCAVGITLLFANVCETSAKEWWHDSFVWEGGTSCESNDSIMTFTSTEAKGWETFCKITKQQKIKGVEAVILDLRCGGDDMDPETTTSQELLVRTEEKMTIFPSGKRYERCSSLRPGASECAIEKRTFRSDEQSPGSYQVLQFKGGVLDGEALLTGYKDNVLAWTASARGTCSNGAVICRLAFDTMNSGEVSDAYLPIEVEGKQWIVLPTIRQNVYQTERYSTMHGKPYGGVVAKLAKDFKPTDDELVLPQNVYKYAGCDETP